MNKVTWEQEVPSRWEMIRNADAGAMQSAGDDPQRVHQAAEQAQQMA